MGRKPLVPKRKGKSLSAPSSVLYRIALSGIALNIVSLLNSSTGGEAFIYYKLRLIIK
jgi:hypothetical protein